MENKDLFASLLQALPRLYRHHSPHGPVHRTLSLAARAEAEELFGKTADGKADFGPFGELVFPYHSMGAIDSLDLFGLDELILFSFYWVNRSRYRRVADIGGNIGLHSVLLSKLGFEVQTYEPDPMHIDRLQTNLELNGCRNVTLIRAAVSDREGSAEFVRVLGNTTGSHLEGAKAAPYGELERFSVDVVDIRPIIAWADFMKIDAEGHEAKILSATSREDWQGTDAMVEVGSPSNADETFEHLRSIGLHMYAQKGNWAPVEGRGDMPESYRDGSLFVSARGDGFWD